MNASSLIAPYLICTLLLTMGCTSPKTGLIQEGPGYYPAQPPLYKSKQMENTSSGIDFKPMPPLEKKVPMSKPNYYGWSLLSLHS